jgi:hypothetical protein
MRAQRSHRELARYPLDSSVVSFFERSLIDCRDQAAIGDLEDRRVLFLLIATITLEYSMPARCWIAPEMPTAA